MMGVCGVRRRSSACRRHLPTPKPSSSFSYCHTAAEPVNTFLYELIGTEGLIRYDRNAKLFEMRNRSGTTALPFAPEKNFAGMYEAFRDALVAGHSAVLPSGEDGLIAARSSRLATEQAMRDRPRA